MSEYEESKADLIVRLFESYGVELNAAQRKHIRRELLLALTQIDWKPEYESIEITKAGMIVHMDAVSRYPELPEDR